MSFSDSDSDSDDSGIDEKLEQEEIFGFTAQTTEQVQEKDKLIEQKKKEIDELLRDAKVNAEIKLKTAVRRNILFVGKSRVGKTTAMNILKDPTHMVKDMNIFADTMQPSLYSFTVEVKGIKEQTKTEIKKVIKRDKEKEMEHKKLQEEEEKFEFDQEREVKGDAIFEEPVLAKNVEMITPEVEETGIIEETEVTEEDEEEEKKKEEVNKEEVNKEEQKVEEAIVVEEQIHLSDELNFNINIIDTPGLFERTANSGSRGNAMLKQTILECLNNEIAFIHAIFFVCSVRSGVSEGDLLAFTQFLDLFSGAESVIAILFTRCENFSLQQKRKIISELNQHTKFKDFLKKVDNRFFFSGSASFEDFDNGLGRTMKKTIASVSQSRNRLLEFILLKTTPCSIRDFHIVKLEAMKIKNLLDSLGAILDNYKPGDQLKEKEIDKKINKIASNVHLIPPRSYKLLAEVQEKINKYEKEKKLTN